MGLLMGSVTTYVVNHALCPVVVVRTARTEPIGRRRSGGSSGMPVRRRSGAFLAGPDHDACEGTQSAQRRAVDARGGPGSAGRLDEGVDPEVRPDAAW